MNCVVCNTPLINRRIDTKTCSGRCRCELHRRNKEASVLVKFRVPLTTYIPFVAATINNGMSVNETIIDMMNIE